MDPLLLDDLRDYLQPFARPDHYAGRRRDHRYAVCSLYLDSEDLRLYQQTVAGERDRFKVRVRSYADDPRQPAYLEVKRKVNNIVHKRRVGIERERVREVLQGQSPSWLGDLHEGGRADLDYFNHHVSMIGARPVLRVRYQREAYEARDNEPARITIDTDLAYALTRGPEIGHAAGRWTVLPTAGAIVEIKFTDRYPWWVQGLVRALALKQQAMPKYALSVDELLERGHLSGLGPAGLLLLPDGD